MKPQIVVLQHTDGTTPGNVIQWLKSRNLPFFHVRLQKGEPLPDPSDISALILCGGGVHVDQESQFPWLRPEKHLIEKVISQGTRIVGLCLGGQLCAQVLGARVGPHHRGWEIGWHDVALTQAALAGFELKKTLKFSQYHRYIFDLPSEATSLASNSWWDVQAFSWKNQILGFQFHPERDAAGNAGIANEKELPTEGQVQTREQVLALGDLHLPASTQWFHGVLDGFLGSAEEADSSDDPGKLVTDP